MEKKQVFFWFVYAAISALDQFRRNFSYFQRDVIAMASSVLQYISMAEGPNSNEDDLKLM
jgi:hypothetical protein